MWCSAYPFPPKEKLIGPFFKVSLLPQFNWDLRFRTVLDFEFELFSGQIWTIELEEDPANQYVDSDGEKWCHSNSARIPNVILKA
ncbi:hypothetical protein AKJ16_DCAP17543 [Drosera capensis]